MSKKTAIQELLEWFEEFYSTDVSREKFKVAIEKEKQQIIDSFHEGGCSVTSCTIGDPETGEEYYSQAYKS